MVYLIVAFVFMAVGFLLAKIYYSPNTEQLYVLEEEVRKIHDELSVTSDLNAAVSSAIARLKRLYE